MADLCQDSAGILGHELRAGGKPLVTSRDDDGFIVDVLAPGPGGAGRCECGKSTGRWSTDALRRAAHARHLQDVRHRQDHRARRRLTVHEVAGRRQGGHEDEGCGGGRAKERQVAAHWSSRCGKRARECASQSPLCAAERRFPPAVSC